MLLCFGVAWPVSIYKSWTSRSTAGKSALFLIIILVGYLAGIINRVLNQPNYVLVFYLINSLMVFIDIVLFYRNKYLETRLADSLSGGTPMDEEMKRHHH